MRLKIVKPVMRIFISGLEGSHKTSLALYFYYRIFQRRGYTLVYIRDKHDKALPLALSNLSNGSKVYIVLDDLTYYFTHSSSEFREFAHVLFRLRHLYPLEAIAIVIVVHYARAIPPALRNSHVYVLTSITSNEDYELARKYFRHEYVDTFRRLWVKNPNNVALINWLGKHFIIDVREIYLEPPAVMVVEETS